MNEIRDFCKNRMCGKKITDAFIAYCKSHIAEYYEIGNGTTTTGILLSLHEDEVEKLWNEFVSELKIILTHDSVT